MIDKKEIAATKKSQTLSEELASKFKVTPAGLWESLRATCFKLPNGVVTDEQMMSLLIVIKEHGLNPFLKELYAYPGKNGDVIPVVGVDGWTRIINDHPKYDGLAFNQSSENITMDGAKPCPEWIECEIFRKDRGHAVTVREYLDEVYQPKRGNYAGPWQSHTKRMLRHKSLIQCARVAFSFSGIYDEDEASRIQGSPSFSTLQTVEAVELITDAQAAQFRDYLESAQLIDSDVLPAIKVEAIEQIPADKFSFAMDVINKKVEFARENAA